MYPAERTTRFNQSMIREMTRLAIEHDAINMSQGFPDFDPPEVIVQAAVEAIRGAANQYTVTWGYPPCGRRWPSSTPPSWDGLWSRTPMSVSFAA